jgi:hypothetical protein
VKHEDRSRDRAAGETPALPGPHAAGETPAPLGDAVGQASRLPLPLPTRPQQLGLLILAGVLVLAVLLRLAGFL